MLLPFWNRAGEKEDLEAQPYSFDDSLGEELCSERQKLHDAAESALNHKIVRLICRSSGLNLTFDALLDDETSVIIRRRFVHQSDPLAERWSVLRFQQEVGLLSWLKENTSIPVAAILAVGTSTYEFSVQEKLPGRDVHYQWHFLSTSQKEHFLSQYADVTLELFRLSVPQRIGSAFIDIADGFKTLKVGPFVGIGPTFCSTKTFDDISQYFEFIVNNKRQSLAESSMTTEDKERAEKTLDIVAKAALSFIEAIEDPIFLRCVLTHADLHNCNILANANGDITGVIDWEFQCIEPAILSAAYPRWIMDDGKYDPEFAPSNNWWEESPEERRRLRAVFEEIVSKRDEEYHRCLLEGKDLRSVMRWMTCDFDNEDPGFDRMGRWGASKLGVQIPRHIL